MTKKRVIKTISFSTKDEYEVELLDFAVNHAEYFGRYIKRLIADHMARVKNEDGDLLVVPPTSQSSSKPSVKKVDKKVEPSPVEDDTIDDDDFSDDMMNFV